MYSPLVIADRIAKAEQAFHRPLHAHTQAEVADWIDRLSDARDEEGAPTRPLLQEEAEFIQNELLMVSCSYLYWAERYAKISIEARDVGPMYPLLDSQRFVLGKIATLEEDAYFGDRIDGILLNILKAARQVGISTLAETMAAHRVTTLNNIFGLLASDVPESSAYLFDMMERVVEHLPWWLRPSEVNHVKNAEILFDGGSHIWVGAGKSTRGTVGQRGQLGRGKALSIVHLSELSSWEWPEQIDSALLPTIPMSPHSLAIFESTAKGRGNWWHEHWKFCRSNPSRFVNIFIPWYVEHKYRSPAPPTWSPAPSTLEHATRCQATAPQWTGKQLTFHRDQLYWYELTRAYHEGKDDLKTFLEEYGSVDDDECFQATGRSIFPTKTLDRIAAGVGTPLAALEVVPLRDIRGRA